MKTKKTTQGVHIVNNIDGIGTPSAVGDKVFIRYTGYLENGDIFDTTEIPDRLPFSFVLGTNKVIKGWEDSILGLRVGGKCTLIIPPELGYGDRGQGSIPSNSILLFDIEVTKIIKQIKDKMTKSFEKKSKIINKKLGREV
jgi:FKBP-type peptidyl-prolyl cis-trans isomerase